MSTKYFIVYSAATFILQAVVVGNILTFGTTLPILVRELETSFLDAVLTWALQVGFFFGGSILAIPGAQKFGPRPIVLIGSLLWFGGLYGISTATTPKEPIAYLGCLNGIGGSLVYWASLSQLCKWSPSNTIVTMGAVLFGGSVGQFAYIFTIPFHIAPIEWKTTYQSAALIGLSLMIASSLFLFQPPSPKVSTTPIGHIRSKNTLLFVLSNILLSFALFPPFYLIVMDAQHMGASFLDATYLLRYMVGGAIVGKIAIVELAKCISPIRAHQLYVLLTALLCFGWLAVQSYVPLVIFSCLYGFTANSITTLLHLVSLDMWDLSDHTTILLLWAFLMAPGAVIGNVATSNMINNALGDIYTSKIFVSCFLFLALIPLMFIKKDPIIEEVQNIELA